MLLQEVCGIMKREEGAREVLSAVGTYGHVFNRQRIQILLHSYTHIYTHECSLHGNPPHFAQHLFPKKYPAHYVPIPHRTYTDLAYTAVSLDTLRRVGEKGSNGVMMKGERRNSL